MSTITTTPKEVLSSQFHEPKLLENPKAAKLISETYIKPKHEINEAKQYYFLTPWDLPFLPANYIQNGLLFSKTSQISIENLLESLKDSLSLTLLHFYPLAGQIATQVDEDVNECTVFVDCKKGPGAKFVHATLDMAITDILSSTYITPSVHSLFDHNGATNYEGVTLPLLSVQVTELIDGVFIGVSMNHVVADGTTFWHFWKTWSQLHGRGNDDKNHLFVARPPVFNHWYQNGYGLGIPLPFPNLNECIARYEPPKLKERFFHFSSESIAKLKCRANKDSNTKKISSFQALTALVWRSVARANYLSRGQVVTRCGLAVNNRQRINPPLPENYFGNSVNIIDASAKANELLEQDLGWAALLVNQCVTSQTNEAVRDLLREWLESPHLYHLKSISSCYTVLMINSPRFDMYGNEFGLGKPLAVRSGRGMNKFPGLVITYPGYEGGGSVDLEICLSPDSMKALESDQEFMAAVSSSPVLLTHLGEQLK